MLYRGKKKAELMDAEARHKITCHTPLTDAGVGDEKQLYTKAKKKLKMHFTFYIYFLL